MRNDPRPESLPFRVRDLERLIAEKYTGKTALLDGIACKIHASKSSQYGKLVPLVALARPMAFSWLYIEKQMRAGGFFSRNRGTV